MQEKDLLQKAMQQKNMMVLYRDELVAPEYAGVPVAVENELVVLQRQTNFVLDGYCALRTGDITEAEQMDDVPFLKKVMAGEKLYDAVKAPGFACRGWQELLDGIMAQYGGWAAVECEGNPEESLYFLGRLMKVDSRYLTMKRVDALGEGVQREGAGIVTGFLWRPVFGDLPEILQVRRRRGKSDDGKADRSKAVARRRRAVALGGQRSQRRFSSSRRMLPQGRYNIIKYIRIVYSGRNGHEEVYQGAGAGVDHAGGE